MNAEAFEKALRGLLRAMVTRVRIAVRRADFEEQLAEASGALDDVDPWSSQAAELNRTIKFLRSAIDELDEQIRTINKHTEAVERRVDEVLQKADEGDKYRLLHLARKIFMTAAPAVQQKLTHSITGGVDLDQAREPGAQLPQGEASKKVVLH